MKFVELFNKKIPLRTHNCRYYDYEPTPIKTPFINIYVRFKGCNANCKFCEYADSASKFNSNKYLEILNEVKSKIKVKKFALTGGEPTLNWDEFKEVIYLTRSIFPDTVIVLNTNGYNLNKLKNDEIIKEIGSLSLSRHHYSDKVNDQIFGSKTPTKKELRNFVSDIDNKYLLNLTCNLIKGYIDNKKEVYKYLEFVSSIGARTAGLVSLMPINEYCKTNLIDFDSLDLISKRFNLTKIHSYENYCKCFNYVYIPKNTTDVINVYYKNTYNPYDIEVNLLYDGENLMSGFTENIIC